MKRLLAVATALALCGSMAMATDLNISVQTAAGDPSTNVAPGAPVQYRVVGVLSDTLNEGLALFGFDLVFDGGVLSSAVAPAEMNSFVKPDGITNPAGFGGTTGVPGHEGQLVQVGGGQNTIKNTVDNAPFPIGSVVTGLGKTQVVLATGSLTAPMTPGTYHLQARNAFANVIKQGETGNPFYATVAAGIGAPADLTIIVGGTCFVESSVPANCAIDARQPSNPNGTNPAGWNSVALTFNAGCSTGAMTAGDFGVTVNPAGTPPTIADVTAVGQVVTLTFATKIPLGAWTCVTHNASGGKVCLGDLPGDVNADRASSAVDILKLIDHLNGQVQPPYQIHQCDADRSGLCGPADILRVIDLLNGADVYDPWLGRTLPVCPSVP